MNTSQSSLEEYDADSPKNPANSGRGTPVAERAGRPECGYEDTGSGMPCTLPVVPGQTRCRKHLDDADQDHEFVSTAKTASGDDVSRPEETRCPRCHTPIPAMLLIGGEARAFPECGPLRGE